MEMYQIRYVLAAAKQLNFTRAAEDCHVSQPALTKGVKALEETLGAALFHREGRRVQLTDFGRSMIPHLQHIADEAEAAQILAQNFRLLEKVPVRLGVLSTIGHMRLARFLAQFEKAYTGVELSVTEAPAAELRDALARDELDVAILTDRGDLPPDLRLTSLYRERYVVVVPPGHRLVQQNAVALRELDGEPYVDRLACELREMVMAVCDKSEVRLYARFRSAREDWVQAMVLAGIGFAFMPEYSVSLPGLVQRPLTEPEVERSVVAATMPGRRHSPAMDALMQNMRGFAWPG
jgi:DNA-binding transcriptional LysR family regulator